MDAAEKEALDKVAKAIADLKAERDAHGGEITGLKGQMDAVQTAMKHLQQVQDAQQRAKVESQMGDNRELDFYTAKSFDGVDASDRPKFMTPKTGSGAIRMQGHWETRVQGGELVRFWRWGLFDDPNPRTKEQAALQRAITRRSLARMHVNTNKHRFSPQLDLEVLDAVDRCGPEVQRIFADSAGIGAEWIPTTMVPELERQILIPTNLAAIFRRRVLRPGTTTIPKRSSNLRAYKGAVPTIDNPADAILSSLTTSSVDVDPVPTVVASQVDRDAVADSLVDIVDEILMEIATAFRFADDDCIVNGDSAATHQDTIASWNTRSRLGGTTGLGTTADHRRRWLGLRARAFDLTSMTTDQNGAQDWAGLRAALAKLGADNMIQGHMTANSVVVLTSWEYFFSKMLAFTEFASWDKVGMLASVLTGQLGSPGATAGGLLPGQVGFVSGMIPVIVAYPLTADLAASGLYTGSGTTTGMVQCDRSRFEYCVRQGTTVESDVEIRNNTVTYVARSRVNFRALDAVASTVKDTHYSYNLTF